VASSARRHWRIWVRKVSFCLPFYLCSYFSFSLSSIILTIRRTFYVAGAIRELLSQNRDVNIVYRFLGTTPASSDLRMLLYGLCQQFYSISEKDVSSIPSDLKVLPLPSFVPPPLPSAHAGLMLFAILSFSSRNCKIFSLRLSNWPLSRNLFTYFWIP
jgi:hypothetical protein